MSEQPSLPTEGDLKKLPLLAIVAYAVRCARRAQPVLDAVPNFAAHAAAVAQAISLTERFCAGNDLNAAADAAERAADAAGRAATLARSFAGGSAAALAAGAAQAAAQATAAVEDFWVRPDSAARVARAKEDLREVELLEEEIRKAISDQVDAAAVSYRAATAALEAASERREASREAYRQVDRAYRVGEATAVELLDATTEATDAANTLIIATAQREYQAIALRHAIGLPPLPDLDSSTPTSEEATP